MWDILPHVRCPASLYLYLDQRWALPSELEGDEAMICLLGRLDSALANPHAGGQ